MRRSLAAPGALLTASVCAALSVHTTHILAAVLGAPDRALIWPLGTLGVIAAASLVAMIHTAIRRRSVPLRFLALAPRAAFATAVLTAAALPWYLHLAGAAFDLQLILAGTAAAVGYFVLLVATLPFIVNSVFSLQETGGVEASPHARISIRDRSR